MIVKVCVGSACYVKGSHIIIKSLESLINEHNLRDKVTLKASFCLGHCTHAVAVEITTEANNASQAKNDAKEIFAVEPQGVTDFFNTQIKEKVI